MSKECELYFDDLAVKGRIYGGKKSLEIRYNEKPNRLFAIYILGLIIYCFYFMFGVGDGFSGMGIGFSVVILIGGVLALYLLMALIPPLKKVFLDYNSIKLNQDVVYAKAFHQEKTVTSKAKVAGRLGAVAMSGALRNQGKRAGSNFWLGVAALAPSEKKVRNYGVTMILNDGTELIVACGQKLSVLIEQLVDSLNFQQVHLFEQHFRDLVLAPQKAVPEIYNNLKELEAEYQNAAVFSEQGQDLATRNKARNKVAGLNEKITVYRRLMRHPRVKEFQSKQDNQDKSNVPLNISEEPVDITQNNGVAEERMDINVADSVKKPLSKYSLTALVSGILSLFILPIPLALVFGVMGIKECRNGDKRGAVLAYIGLVFAALFIVLIIASMNYSGAKSG